ncbi:Beta-hexosaminidase 2 [Zalerion maritima]|uniref:Beta-hexosaminidase n=1 Tax=Zalerion maritima TaxID=339359 RepID=A0AAD5WTR9_9PEZI|nr:Beta-hexosaminidase 2 [Zalerion maritima]
MLRPLAVVLSLAASASAIWPAPISMTQGNSTLWLTQTVEITYNGDFMPYTYGYTPTGPDWTSKDIVQGGVSRALGQIFGDYFVPWMLHTREEQATFEPKVMSNKTWIESLEITQTGEDSEDTWKAAAGEVDESYSLSLSKDGKAKIGAASSIGVLHALQTFTQLFYRHSGGPFWYTPMAPIDIEDSPTFAHRGLLMDVSRHYFPMEDIYRTLDALSWNKMNRLHIHATDSQSWPLEIPSLPEVSAKGAYHPSLVYTPTDLKNIQEYGAMRAVQVIIEIDMPGHIGVLGESHPELVVAYDERPYYWWCAQPPCGALRLNNSDVDEFLGTLFEDLLPRVSPYSSYFHTGGDELNANDSMLDPGVQSNDTEVLKPLLQNFIDLNHGRVKDAGLTPIVWEEMAIDWDIDMDPETTVVQSWLGTVSNLTEKGFKVIDTNYNFWYLDCGRGQWLTFDNDANATFYPFNDWCGPTKPWQLIYSHDPTEGLPEEQAKLVIGGEVAAWSETIDPANMDTLVWPRAGAAAEVLWSGRYDADGEPRSQLDAAPRLQEMRARMVTRGVKASPITQQWCVQMGGDPLACSYDLNPYGH